MTQGDPNSTTTNPATRRRHHRVDCDLTVAYILGEDAEPGSARVLNLGLGGARVDFPEALRLPADVRLIFREGPDGPLQGGPLEIPARVVWTVADRDGGPWPSGLQFRNLEDIERRRLHVLIAELLT